MTMSSSLTGVLLTPEALERTKDLVGEYALTHMRRVVEDTKDQDNDWARGWRSELLERETGTWNQPRIKVEQIIRGEVTLDNYAGNSMGADDQLALWKEPWDSCTLEIEDYSGPNVQLRSAFGSVNVRVTGTGEIDEAEVLARVSAILRDYPMPPIELPEPEPVPMRPFEIALGHGGSEDWRELHYALTSKHGFVLREFDSEPTAGRLIRDVVAGLAARSTAAIVVLTQAFTLEGGGYLPRMNVVHEVGYFQAKLGWDRVIVLIEEGIEPPSNLQGTLHIRFASGQISSTVGDVVARLHAIKGEAGLI